MQVEPAKKRKGIYKFITTEDLTYKDTAIKKTFENDWLLINESGDIVVKGSFGSGYAWDGCTPKWNIFDLLLVGTPDGRTIVNTGKPITYYASLVHDILCQFNEDIGISRKEADDLFLVYLGDFNLRYVYYIAVRSFGTYLDFKSYLISKFVKKNWLT
ncbi:MAG: hypothetical protein R8M46_02870 [Ghiorsea sp.]